MKKLICLLLIALAFIFSGCENKEEQKKNLNIKAEQEITSIIVPLGEIKEKEQRYSARIEEYLKDISGWYNSYESGQMNREDLNSRLSQIHPEVWGLIKEAESYHKNYTVIEAEKEEYNLLLKSKTMRECVLSMINGPVHGLIVVRADERDKNGHVKAERKILTNEEVLVHYKSKLIEYQKYKIIVFDVLSKN